MALQDQGQQVLGASLRAMLPDDTKHSVLKTLAGAYTGNVLLHKWTLLAPGYCASDLCACLAETQAYIQRVCHALNRASIAAAM